MKVTGEASQEKWALPEKLACQAQKYILGKGLHHSSRITLQSDSAGKCPQCTPIPHRKQMVTAIPLYKNRLLFLSLDDAMIFFDRKTINPGLNNDPTHEVM